MARDCYRSWRNVPDAYIVWTTLKCQITITAEFTSNAKLPQIWCNQLSAIPEVCKDRMRSLHKRYMLCSGPSQSGIELSRRYHSNHCCLTDIQPTRSGRLTLSSYTITDLTPRLDDQYWTVSHATRIPKLSIVILDLTIVGTVPTITPCAYCRLRIITLGPRDKLNVTRRSDTSSERVTDTR